MAIEIGNRNVEYEQLVSYGRENDSVWDKLCAFLLAVSPLLQHYRGFYENAGFSALLLIFPILFFRFLAGRKDGRLSSRNLIAILPLVAFEIYTAVVHPTSAIRLMYIAFMICVFVCIAGGCVNTVYFLKYATMVVCIAAMLLVVQYISYYVFHYTLDLRPFSLLVDQDSIWIEHLATASADKLYRPAAFFLEPSHLFLYSFPLLCIYLLSPNMTRWRRNKAVLITLAMLMSTSGFSIVACLGLWSLYFLIYKKGASDKHVDLKKVFSARNVFILLLLVILLVLAYSFVPVFQRSVNRILTDTEGTNAIAGRIKSAQRYVSKITGSAIWFGTPNVTGTLDFNLAGFFATSIKWGTLGLLFSYWFYGRGLFRLKKKYFWMTAIILVISFFSAHTHGTFYMTYYIVFLMNGYYEKGVEPMLATSGEAAPCYQH